MRRTGFLIILEQNRNEKNFINNRFGIHYYCSGDAQTQNENVFQLFRSKWKSCVSTIYHTHQGMSELRYTPCYISGVKTIMLAIRLSGIRFNEKKKSITVSSKVELLLPENSDGDRLKKMMNYRFDASITSAGCVLIIRDVTYQDGDSKAFSKALLSRRDDY